MLETPEQPKPELPGQRIVRVPLEMMGYILDANSPIYLHRNGSLPEKDDKLWLTRCTNWPKDGRVVGMHYEFDRNEVWFKIESLEFKRDPDGYAIQCIDLQYSRTWVREVTLEESVQHCARGYLADIPCDGPIIHVGWTKDWTKLHTCHRHNRLVARDIVHPIQDKETGGYNMPPEVAKAVHDQYVREWRDEVFPKTVTDFGFDSAEPGAERTVKVAHLPIPSGQVMVGTPHTWDDCDKPIEVKRANP